MTTEARFSFLTAGPKFRLELPDDFEPLPDLSAPLMIWDQGARSFDFVARARDTGPQEAHKTLGTLTSRDGYTVEIYERLDAPPQWYLRWILPTGSIYTHLREEDGVERAEAVVANLQIVNGDGPPFLLPEGPLRRAVSSRPGYQELATFRSSDLSRTIECQRPGYLSRGKFMRVPESKRAIVRAGAGSDIEITVHAGTDVQDGRKLIVAAVDTLAPV
jgi:hypothetical protein